MSITSVREKRQTTIPLKVSEAAQIGPGDRVEWRFEAGEIRGRKVVPAVPVELGLADVDPRTLLPKGAKITAESIVRAIRADRDRA